MIFAKGATIFLLLFLFGVGMQVRAQNQTPANIAPVVGAWTDPATGLTWTKADNGSDVNWNQANAYCSNLRLGGFSDWRLPTIDELQGIYDPSIDVPGVHLDGTPVMRHYKGNLRISGRQWSSSQENANESWQFDYFHEKRYSFRVSDSRLDRALCVRR
jgi:hypothetical protein